MSASSLPNDFRQADFLTIATIRDRPRLFEKTEIVASPLLLALLATCPAALRLRQASSRLTQVSATET